MTTVPFIKAVASGNDFILIDNCQNQLSAISSQLSDFVKTICQRKKSVGADGVLLIETSDVADCKMRIFNPDGSEVTMCGNGARCIALFGLEKMMAGQSQRIETRAGILEAQLLGGQGVKVKMSDPEDIRLDFDLAIDGKNYRVNFINTGVPHVVNFVDDLEGIDVKVLGSKIRYHDEFKPEGTNADFVKVRDDGAINVRTYERGVEDETSSCGTGAVAGAIVTFRLRGLTPPINVHTRDGEVLKVYFSQEGGKIVDVYLEGEAKLVYEGVLNYV